MTLIYKYELPGQLGVYELEMPQGAVVLHVASVNDVVCLWATVEPGRLSEQRTFVIAGTGQPMEQAAALGEHVGTAITLNGKLVWHVFDVGVL